jgi:uncharacterized membrane protein
VKAFFLPYNARVNKSLFARWQANFWAGLAIVLPGVLSVAVLLWLFGTVANITDSLLIFLPRAMTHRDQGAGPMYWYWSLVALVLAVLLIGVVGLLARNYFGKKVIEWVDAGLRHVPLLNKIYAATKQVNDAFSSGGKTSFRTVVMIEFPRQGMYSVGFLTNEAPDNSVQPSAEKMVCVFIPTTPNPTSGFMVLVPDHEVRRLSMSVADGVKYIISLGAIGPEQVPGRLDAKPRVPAV